MTGGYVENARSCSREWTNIGSAKEQEIFSFTMGDALDGNVGGLEGVNGTVRVAFSDRWMRGRNVKERSSVQNLRAS